MKALWICVTILMTVACLGDKNRQRIATVDTPDGEIEVNVTTTDPVPQEIIELTSSELEAIETSAGSAAAFVAEYCQIKESQGWGLKEVDDAFRAWVKSADPNKVSNDQVVNVIGSWFGEYCCERLGMRWVTVKDQVGTDFAVRSEENEVMAFPYSTVIKRVEDREHTFLEPVFYSLAQMVETDKFWDSESE